MGEHGAMAVAAASPELGAPELTCTQPSSPESSRAHLSSPSSSSPTLIHPGHPISPEATHAPTDTHPKSPALLRQEARCPRDRLRGQAPPGSPCPLLSCGFHYLVHLPPPTPPLLWSAPPLTQPPTCDLSVLMCPLPSPLSSIHDLCLPLSLSLRIPSPHPYDLSPSSHSLHTPPPACLYYCFIISSSFLGERERQSERVRSKRREEEEMME